MRKRSRVDSGFGIGLAICLIGVAMAPSSAAAGDEEPARVAFWQGMYNVHTEVDGTWASDPEDDDGAEVDKLAYCRQLYPATTSVRRYKKEFIDVFRNVEDEPFAGKVWTFECVQPPRPAQRVMFAKGMYAMHVDAAGAWVADPERDDGYDVDKLAYCRAFYPKTTAIKALGKEFSRGWLNAEEEAFAVTATAYQCVQGAASTKPAPKAGATTTPTTTPAESTPQEACVDWAYDRYYQSLTSESARTKAHAACKTITSLDAAKLLFDWYYKSLTAVAAMDKLTPLATTELEGEVALLRFAFDGYFKSLTGVAAADKAVAAGRRLAASATRCLQREYPIFYKSLTSVAAMDKAVEVCAGEE